MRLISLICLIMLISFSSAVALEGVFLSPGIQTVSGDWEDYYDNSPSINLGLNYSVHPKIHLCFSMGYSFLDFKDVESYVLKTQYPYLLPSELSERISDTEGLGTQIIPLILRGNYVPMPYRNLSPYLTAGIGFYLVNNSGEVKIGSKEYSVDGANNWIKKQSPFGEVDSFNDGNYFGICFGGGVEYNISRKFSVDFNGLFHVIKQGDTENFGDYNILQFSVGVLYFIR